MNFAKGILESRKQHYKALKGVIKPIPLNTPTDVEIGLEQVIRVTLLDANHCAGAVMFLVEDRQKAILYTGDIRSETWWINSLARHPTFIPYTSGIRRLDNVYLDTTFASKDERYRTFTSKGDGIKELLEKVLKYPADTTFHFHAWTLGYEDIWLALSSALRSQVHVDRYKSLLYGSLAAENASQFHYHEGPALSGYQNGNHYQKGCLTEDKSVKLHSCEHGTGCPASSSSTTVYITPILNRDNSDKVLSEIGAGGGGGDLLQNHGYLELDDQNFVERMFDVCNTQIEDVAIRSKVYDKIQMALGTSRQAMCLLLDEVSPSSSKGNIKVEDFIESLVKGVMSCENNAEVDAREAASIKGLPCRIQFSYSRHSSYEELCELVAVLRPRDIYPCTTDWREWTWDESVESLFGHLSDLALAFDQDMAGLESQRPNSQGLKRPCSSSMSPQTPSSEGGELLSSRPLTRSAKKTVAHQCQGTRDLLDTEGFTYPKPKIDEIRRSFEHPFKVLRAQRELKSLIGKPETIAHMINSQPETRHPHQSQISDDDSQGLVLTGSVSACELGPDSQVKPNEIPEDVSFGIGSPAQDGALIESVPEPENIVTSIKGLSSLQESQITVSDATFESQGLASTPHEHEVRIWSRKQAYIAAKGLHSAWGEEYSLISSSADHGEEVKL